LSADRTTYVWYPAWDWNGKGEAMQFRVGVIGAGRVGWSNKQFDELVAKGDIEPDAAKRADYYSQAQKILIEDAPVAFVNNDVIPYLIKPYVQGVNKDTITPLDYIPGFFNLKNVDVAP